MINSWCRSQQKIPHNQGSAAFVSVFNELRQKEEGGFMPDRIALFKFTRSKDDHHARDFNIDGNPMTVDQVYDVVMGTRSGYIKGMGNGPKPQTSRSTRASTSHLEEQMKTTMNENSQLKTELADLKMKFQQYEELLAALAAERSNQNWEEEGKLHNRNNRVSCDADLAGNQQPPKPPASNATIVFRMLLQQEPYTQLRMKSET
nr:Transposase, Ptta/En/Spm, plant [Ipomoea batatas]